ncbi:hypothetical protein L1049_002099 [Liquidambar formosana]|uniref:Uncharacterized protein n=1 Tax=Liquidambar formosana TaxID=63359 RepID=A0AAP0NGF7_LIQFO
MHSKGSIVAAYPPPAATSGHSAVANPHCRQLAPKAWLIIKCEKIVRALKPDSKQPKRHRGITRESYSARLAVLKSGAKFKVSIFEEAQRSLAQTFNNANIPPSQLMSVLELQAGGLQNIGCTEQDIRNVRRDTIKAIDGHHADMLNEHFLAQKERNPYFTDTIEIDDENRISHIF